MVIGRNGEIINMELIKETIEKVESFKCLGINLYRKGDEENVSKISIQAAPRMYHAARNTIFVPTLRFDSESFQPDKQNEKQGCKV